jgi:hypothetical protein
LNRQLRVTHAVALATITGSRARGQRRRLAAHREHVGVRMGLLQGLSYNLRGLSLGLKTPKLLLLGLIRFVNILFLAFAPVGATLYYVETRNGAKHEMKGTGA